MQLFLEKQCIRAKRDEFPLCHDARDDLLDLLMDEWLTPGMATIGAPHSSTASRHCSTVSRLSRMGRG